METTYNDCAQAGFLLFRVFKAPSPQNPIPLSLEIVPPEQVGNFNSYPIPSAEVLLGTWGMVKYKQDKTESNCLLARVESMLSSTLNSVL